MKLTICILALHAACVGCSRSPDSPVETQAALPAVNATLEAPDPKWRVMFFEGSTALSNVPEISVKSTDGKLIRVTARNVGTTTLRYLSGGAEHIQLFQETKVAGRWTQSNWDWCGTGKSVFEIAPNQSAELVVEFWDDKKQERLLATFSEKDTNRAGLVVLAFEADK